MGLKEFETEGPRMTKSDEDERKPIHILRGSNVDTTMIPHSHAVHRVSVKEDLVAFDMGSMEPPYYVCTSCGRVSTDFKGMVKKDKLDNIDEDWIDEAFEAIIEAYEQVDIEAESTKSIDDIKIPLDDEEEDEDDDDRMLGLDSFKT